MDKKEGMPKYKKGIASVIVAEDIYKDIDKIREKCIECILGDRDNEDINIKGNDFRWSDYRGKFNEIENSEPYLREAIYQVELIFMEEHRELLEKLVKRRIVNINNESGNFHLHTCLNGSETVIIHDDVNYDEKYDQWKAVIFLTPNPPISGGINFKRNTEYGISSLTSGLKNIEPNVRNAIINNIRRDAKDLTKWSQDSSIGNKYNRIVIFKTDLFYSYGMNFGKNIDTSKLFQEFTFTTIRE